MKYRNSNSELEFLSTLRQRLGVSRVSKTANSFAVRNDEKSGGGITDEFGKKPSDCRFTGGNIELRNALTRRDDVSDPGMYIFSRDCTNRTAGINRKIQSFGAGKTIETSIG